MKYREYYRLTRPSVDIPFHPPESMFYQNEELALWPTDVYTQDPSIPPSPVHKYYLENYHNDCLPVEASGYLSEDGLTVTYTVIYKSEEIMNKLLNDPWFSARQSVQREHNNKYNIIGSDEYIPIED
jgi:hypothetical protein